MQTLILTAFALCSCAGQSDVIADPRWALWKEDSTKAIVPVEDLRQAAGFRLAQDNRVHDMLFEISRHSALQIEQQKAIEDRDQKISDKDEQIGLSQFSADQYKASSEKWEKQAHKNNSSKWWQIPAAILFGMLLHDITTN